MSASVEKCFVSGCQLLCLLAQLHLSHDTVGDCKGMYIHVYVYIHVHPVLQVKMLAWLEPNIHDATLLYTINILDLLHGIEIVSIPCNLLHMQQETTQ